MSQKYTINNYIHVNMHLSEIRRVPNFEAYLAQTFRISCFWRRKRSFCIIVVNVIGLAQSKLERQSQKDTFIQTDD